MESAPNVNLHSVPDDELLHRLEELVFQSRRVEADLVAHIGEADERRLFARLAYPSMFAYCTEALHLSEAETYRRITAARVARKHPRVLAMLRDGRLHLSGIALLAPVLTPDNCDGVLGEATHRSKREIEKLVANLAPRPDAPAVIRKLPGPRQGPVPGGSAGCVARRDGAVEVAPDSALGGLFPGRVEGIAEVPSASAPTSVSAGGVVSTTAPNPMAAAAAGAAGAPGGSAAATAEADLTLVESGPRPALPPRPAVVEPLSSTRYKVQFTASGELHDKLQRLSALLRSRRGCRDLAAVIDWAVSEGLERLEARRFARTRAPRQALDQSDVSPDSRHIPAAVRRAVCERDGNRCRYVDHQGRRCSERSRLEFHHAHPFGMGGSHSPDNVRLLCPAHNRYLAELDYGRATLTRHREATCSGASSRPGCSRASAGSRTARS